MIHQFAELGDYYQQREGIGASDGNPCAQYAQDPAQKFRTNTVLLLVFGAKSESKSDARLVRVQVEQYDDSKKLLYLYRPGPPNGSDATPTSRFPDVKAKREEFESNFAQEVRKKLKRLNLSVEEALSDAPHNEKEALEKIRAALNDTGDESKPDRISTLAACQIQQSLPPTVDERRGTTIFHQAIVSIAWQEGADLKHVGDFKAFRQSLIRRGSREHSSKGGGDVQVRGVGQCCICGKQDVEVSGLLQIPNFRVYTLDKPGSVSGGFDPLLAWRNFPVCNDCCKHVDFSGERVKKHLSFDYYGFKYLFLPSLVKPGTSVVYDFLDRLTVARLNHASIKRLTAAEDEIFYVVAQEQNQLQVDLLFYEPDPQSFRPALYVSGLVPTRFRKLFDAKDEVDGHPWFKTPSSAAFTGGSFTFGSLRNVLPRDHGGASFDDDFLAATRAALELRQFPIERLLRIGMRWVSQDYRGGKPWQSRLADLYRSILFFEVLTSGGMRSATPMATNFGTSEQAKRVEAVLAQANGKLRTDPAAQAAFLVGAGCSRIEMIQKQVRGASPFSGKLKGFRLTQADVQRLFVAAKEKSRAYGPDEEAKVSGLLECTALALAVSPEQWPLSPDEVSYFFALGHALRPRFAKDSEKTVASTGVP